MAIIMFLLADVRYRIKIFIESNVFHNKPENGSEIMKFKNLCYFAIVNFIQIYCYKKHA